MYKALYKLICLLYLPTIKSWRNFCKYEDSTISQLSSLNCHLNVSVRFL